MIGRKRLELVTAAEMEVVVEPVTTAGIPAALLP